MGFWLVFIIVTVLVLIIGPFALAFIPVAGPILSQILRTIRSVIVNILKPFAKIALKILKVVISMIPTVLLSAVILVVMGPAGQIGFWVSKGNSGSTLADTGKKVADRFKAALTGKKDTHGYNEAKEGVVNGKAQYAADKTKIAAEKKAHDEMRADNKAHAEAKKGATPEEKKELDEAKHKKETAEIEENKISEDEFKAKENAKIEADKNITQLKASKSENIARVRASDLTDKEKKDQIAEIKKNADKQIADEEDRHKKLEDDLHKAAKDRTKEIKKESREKGPSVRHEHPVVAYTFYLSIILLIVLMGFDVPDTFRVAVVMAIVVSGIAYIIYKRKASDKKTSKKYIATIIIVAILVVSMVPGIFCTWSTGVPLFSFTCALEDSVSAPLRSIVGGTISGVFSSVKNWGLGVIRNMLPNNPLIKNLKTQSCYPFCTDPTGSDTKWHGLEVTRLEMIPHTIYSHQQFSVVIQFENKGKTPATFTPPIPKKGGVQPGFFARLKELFGFGSDEEFQAGLTLGCRRECKFDFNAGKWIADSFGVEEQGVIEEGEETLELENAKCQEVCPLNAATDEKPYVAGGCSKEVTYQMGEDITDIDNFGKTLTAAGISWGDFGAMRSNGEIEDGSLIPNAPCTLEPGDILAMTWYGLTVHDNMAIEMGKKIKPEVDMQLQYTYSPANDLIGTMSMMSAETQVAGAESKSIGKIANKISQSYSPTGPLMMALGTAEDQIVFGSPMFFMVQFTNKAKGTIPLISRDSQLLYLPASFKIRPASCDFEPVVSSQLKKYDIGKFCTNWRDPEDCPEWYPGPNFAAEDSEDGTVYNIYRPTHKIETVGKGQDPLYNPLYYCVIDTPKGTQLSSYVSKYRVLDYAYQEVKKADIEIIGTEIYTDPTDPNVDSEIEGGGGAEALN